MSFTPSVKGDVKGKLDATVVDGLQTRPVNPAAPNINDVLTWDGANWSPLPPGGTPADALAASLVFQPGGVAGGNVFTTWATLYAAFLTTKGPVIIAVDSTIAAANVPAGAYDFNGRVKLVPLNPRFVGTGALPLNVLNVQDGAVIANMTAIEGPLQVTLNQTLAESLTFTIGAGSISRLVTLANYAVLKDAGTFRALSVPAATSILFLLLSASQIDASTATAVFAAIPAASFLRVEQYDSAQIQGNIAGFVSGPIGSTFGYIYDSSVFPTPPASPAFLGTNVNAPLDQAAGVFYNNAAVAAPHAPNLTGNFVQAAIDQLNKNTAERISPLITNALAAYAIDSTAPNVDQTILNNIQGAVYALPSAATSSTREITIKDITNSPLAPLFSVAPNGADTIEGVNANYTENIPLASVTLKSNGINGWWIV